MREVLDFEYKSTSEFSQPVYNHSFLLRCTPENSKGQKVKVVASNTQIAVETQNFASLQTAIDGFGNSTMFGLIKDYHNTFSVISSGRVEIDNSLTDKTFCPVFKYPSPLTMPNAELIDFAKTFAGNSAAQTLKNLGAAVHDKIAYKPAVTSISTTSSEVFAQKSGVCQDLSHVLITCLRINGIAARYVSGYVKGLKLSHAWTEAFYDGCWHAFDATENFFVTNGYIKIAHGRDAADCPLNRGIYYGNAIETMNIEIEVK